MLDQGGFAFDLDADEGLSAEDMAEVFSVPGLPALPALKPRYGESETRVLHPLWHSQPEGGIVEALQQACDTYEPPAVAEVPATRRSRRRRRASG